jgi:glutamyl-tRNA(Gln) amidotransferase subunit D
MSTSDAESRVSGPVGLVLTGGTAGSEIKDGVADLGNAAEMVLINTAQSEVADIRIVSPLRKLSENMQPQDWVSIANSIRELVEKDGAKGVLIIHGTDTMAFASAALSFLLADLKTPVVITGANLPPLEKGSDAQMNVRDALVTLKWLMAREHPGVYLSFSGIPGRPSHVFAGANVRKMIAAGAAYESVDRKIVGRVSHGAFHLVSTIPRISPANGTTPAVDPRVRFIKVMPGVDFKAEADEVIRRGTRGVVLELYASGTGPVSSDQYSLNGFIRTVSDAGVAVATTVANGASHNYEYSTEVALHQAGDISLPLTPPDTAYVKMMWALAQSPSKKRVEQLMLTNIAGELGKQANPPAAPGLAVA